jgi:hypothetical protein
MFMGLRLLVGSMATPGEVARETDANLEDPKAGSQLRRR